MTQFKDRNGPMFPKGMATFLPEGAVHKRHIEETVLSVFLSWGYQEVIPPIFEYLDVITLGMGQELIEKGYKFVDRGSGRLMLLRPDVTPQIARMAAMLMADVPKPLRLCYRANVFRHEEEHAGRARELFQIGGELIGPEGAEADAEIISIAIQSLLKVGLKDFKVALGQVAFFQGLINGTNSPPEIRKQIQIAVSRKDESRLKEILKQAHVPENKARQITKLLFLLGQEDVIDRAWDLSKSSECRSALRQLRDVYRILVSCGWKEYLLIDLAEIRGLDYYTGMNFEVFSKDLGVPLGQGGRYDGLIGKFGAPCPSTGFAFNVEQLQWAWQKSGRVPPEAGPDFAVLDLQGDLVRPFSLARTLREKGYRVVQYSRKMDINEAVDRARLSGIKRVLAIKNADRVVLVDCRTGKKRDDKMKLIVSKL